MDTHSNAKSVSRTILLADFDSFFASCEQHFNPNLRGRPIGITAENGRNAVIAASREAKKAGVKSPNTTWEAKRICPEIEFVKGDFERYLEITKKFLAIATDYSPLVELFSLDEAFIDMTSVLHLYTSLDEMIFDFKRRIRDEIGSTITVSIGVSHNKLLAKLASGLNKPDGYFKIDYKNMNKVYHEIEINAVCGIGERYKRRLSLIGIHTLHDLRAYPLHLLRAEFGNLPSQHLKQISLGLDPSPVNSYMEETVAKSVGRNYCLPKNTYDQKEILLVVRELCEEIAVKLRRIHKKTRTVGLYFAGERSMGARKTITAYTNRGEDIYSVCMYLYKSWEWNSMVRQVSIWTSNLIDEDCDTLPLFPETRKEMINRVVDEVNDRFGHHTIRTGQTMQTRALHTKPNGFMADKYQRQQLRNLRNFNT